LNPRLETLLAHHRQKTGAEATAVFQAPGRVNLLGEHTDYSGGFCMPAALNFNTLVAASPRPDRLLRLHSIDFGETAEADLNALTIPAKSGHPHWFHYCQGVAWSLQRQPLQQEPGIELVGCDLTLSGNVPRGAGLSSSASVEVATATALLALAGQTLPKPNVALSCQRAENQFVHGSCGIMDQLISACGVRGNALAIDTRAMTAELAPIPAHLRLVVCNSMVTHQVAGESPYAQRRREVEEAARVLGKQLRDATLEELVAARPHMSHEAFLRARHVITDSQRVLDGVACLRAGDAPGFGALMTAAHASFRDDFGASCPRCDLLVTLALALPGCLGSRLTGGGFGGCTVSLVEADAVESFAATIRQQFQAATGTHPDVFICAIADGAGQVQP
jgi:galactokinase